MPAPNFGEISAQGNFVRQIFMDQRQSWYERPEDMDKLPGEWGRRTKFTMEDDPQRRMIYLKAECYTPTGKHYGVVVCIPQKDMQRGSRQAFH